MSVTHLDVTRRTPFADDYERIDGLLHFAVDPSNPANQRIVDLDRAARNSAGQVQFAADFVLLQPRAAERANRRLLFYVVNRGLRVGVPFNRVPARDQTLPPTDEIDPGDGFLLRHGWTIAMCGWQWDVRRQPGLMGLEAPQALGADGQPLRGRISVAFQPNEPHNAHLLSHWPLHPPPGKITLSHQPYPAADVDEAEAELTVRDSLHGPRTVIPRASWRFAREDRGQVVADDSYVWLAGGFVPGRWYEVTYTTRACPVVGTGMLAVRDCVSWLRDADDGNPAAGRIDFTYGYGVSQCGRFLRQFLYDGLNVDESGQQVFDGLNPHVAGARRGEFNQRFGQPSETSARGFGGLPPFEPGELLQRQREVGGVPRIFETNTSSEYWRSDCSLIHTDLSGTRDVEPPTEQRTYLIAGHRHGPGDAELTDTTPAGARGANAFTTVDGSAVFRALLARLDDWVSRGIEPPPSAFPRLADGTAAPREAVLDQMRALPGLVLLDPAQLPTLRSLDLGPDVGSGIARLPAQSGAPYPSFASTVDADGNELAGIRLPDLTVPVATHTGWVARHPDTGAPGQLVDMMGVTLPFASTPAERNGDPRPSIAERYRDRDDYVARARVAAEELARERYILDEDIDLVVELAAQRYDVLVARRTPIGAT